MPQAEQEQARLSVSDGFVRLVYLAAAAYPKYESTSSGALQQFMSGMLQELNTLHDNYKAFLETGEAIFAASLTEVNAFAKENGLSGSQELTELKSCLQLAMRAFSGARTAMTSHEVSNVGAWNVDKAFAHFAAAAITDPPTSAQLDVIKNRTTEAHTLNLETFKDCMAKSSKKFDTLRKACVDTLATGLISDLSVRGFGYGGFP